MLSTHSTLSTRSTLGLSALTLLSFTACGKVNNMYDATMGMAGTTNSMNATTCKMYTSLRQGNAKISRDADIKAIEEGKDISEKLELAAKYMQGLEYQVWSKSCEEVAPREIALKQAALEILNNVAKFHHDGSKVSALMRTADYESLYALAATLHRTNELQPFYLQGTAEKMVRPLDLLVEGLRLNQAKNRGELTENQIPSWASTTGTYTDDATFLLRLRANFLMAYAYALADSDSFGNRPSLMEKIVRIGSSKLLSKKWTPNLADMDPTEVRGRIIKSLTLAHETRTALVSLGIDPMTDETMAGIWRNADFSKYDLEKMEKNGGEDRSRAAAIKDLVNARDQMLSHGSEGQW